MDVDPVVLARQLITVIVEEDGERDVLQVPVTSTGERYRLIGPSDGAIFALRVEVVLVLFVLLQVPPQL